MLHAPKPYLKRLSRLLLSQLGRREPLRDSVINERQQLLGGGIGVAPLDLPRRVLGLPHS